MGSAEETEVVPGAATTGAVALKSAGPSCGGMPIPAVATARTSRFEGDADVGADGLAAGTKSLVAEGAINPAAAHSDKTANTPAANAADFLRDMADLAFEKRPADRKTENASTARLFRLVDNRTVWSASNQVACKGTNLV